MSTIKTIMRGFALTVAGTCAFQTAAAQTLTEEEYFSEAGLDVLIFSNWYDSLFSDAKMSGVEIIHHGERNVTNGDVRLSATPGQWEPIGTFKSRNVDREAGTIEAQLEYPDYNFAYTIRGEYTDGTYRITVSSDAPVPAELVGRAGFNLEFIPAAYAGTTYLADGQTGQLPVYPHGEMTLRPDGPRPDGAAAEPLPLAVGQQIVLAAGDPDHRMSIRTQSGEISVYDGRNQAQNGWFVLRGLLPGETSGTLIDWRISASTHENWVRDPVVSYNQLGYLPEREKVAMVEMDKSDTDLKTMRLLRIDETGDERTVLSGLPEKWGRYLRYSYAKFDFSQVTEPGIYRLSYGDQTGAAFRISEDVYDQAWHPTLDIFFPAQMDHMFVNEAYRVWHGRSHMDDALQAPVDHEHHDLYRQGPTTDTEFEPLEHIPGLNVGGWYDAGDFDIRTQSQYGTIRRLAAIWDDFAPLRDQTKVDWVRQRADMHVPDGDPDLLQQIKHGTMQLMAQFDAVGFAIHGIVEPDLDQYTHLGDGVTKTDNLIYDAGLGADEVSGNRSGKLDDRWAFTSRSSALQYGSASGLAAAARALEGYDSDFAARTLAKAEEVFADEQSREPDLFRHGNTTGGPLAMEKFFAAAELLHTTGDEKYISAVDEAFDEGQDYLGALISKAIAVRPLMPESFDAKLRAAVEGYLQSNAEARADNPFGVEITRGGWAGNGTVINQAITDYAIHTAYPDLMSKEQVFAGFDYTLGRHPAHNLSLVSGVGAQSKKVGYGTNRADFSYIAGGPVPGILILKPDYPENREDWPYFWGQNEYVIPMGAIYIYLASAAAALGE